MRIVDLPHEIISEILLLAARANEADGAAFSYGLSYLPLADQKARVSKYVRGPLSSECLRWDATNSIRQVCHSWHRWALAYNLEHVFERKWRGAERWADLPINRRLYQLYELNDRPAGYSINRDPLGSLKHTDQLFASYPTISRHVRRLWFNGFHTAETDRLLMSVISRCSELEFLSVPWTLLRRGTVDDWMSLLNVNEARGRPLRSLELTAVSLSSDLASELARDSTSNPLEDPRVDFGQLRRLKIFGNTLHKPICDSDLELISRTATNLETLDLTNLSTISVAGMLSLVRASHDTLKSLEHSPRSDDGFFHPFPGAIDEHVCELLVSLPRLRDLSISVPHMCADVFSNVEVQWTGDCQVRTTDICGCNSDTAVHTREQKLRDIFAAARKLEAARRRMGYTLYIEIFFAGCIFEPGKRLVHGDFTWPSVSSGGLWPPTHQASTKGPYGTSGVYGKEEGSWDAVSEDDYLYAMSRRWITV